MPGRTAAPGRGRSHERSGIPKTFIESGSPLSLLALALVTATPATLPLVLETVRPGDTIALRSGTYATVVIRRTFSTPITIDASGSFVRGVQISGGGVVWRSGTIIAPLGQEGIGSTGYGALVTGTNVTFSGVYFSKARKGIVLDRAARVTISDSTFRGIGEDGVIASRTAGLTIVRNTFDRTVGKPSTCVTKKRVIRGLAKRDCEAQGGVWDDGWHPDAVQMRNAVTDAVITDNVLDGNTQGLTQMDTAGDAPLQRVRIERNTVSVNAHHITLGDCAGCTIRGNTVRRWRRDSYKAIIRPGKARRCGNVVQDEASDGRC